MNQFFHPNSFLKKITFKLLLLILFCFANSCSSVNSSVKQLAIENDAERLLKQSDVFSNQFTGFSLFDLEKNAYVAGHNSTLKFTPASTTKLLTMYATLRSFSDSIPAFAYNAKDSTVVVRPLGDPTFLYAPFQYQKAVNFLNTYSTVSVLWPDRDLPPYGPGWAWDDYRYDYQPQRSWWPIYGNTVSIAESADSISVIPRFFREYVEVISQTKSGELVERDLKFNVFKVSIENDTSSVNHKIPFEYSKELLVQLLQDTLKPRIEFIPQAPMHLSDTLYSHHVDTLLEQMLKPSDNLIAEQLLLMASEKNGHTNTKSFIAHIKNSWLVSLNDMVWVDGSGLSRYNLISPVDQVRLLKKSVDEFGWERISRLLPSGGEGTLADSYLGNEDEEPYIFAKTGSLSNNYSLTGLLITRSGKRMIFSFMSNHYTRPTGEVKKAMEKFLLDIRNAY